MKRLALFATTAALALQGCVARKKQKSENKPIPYPIAHQAESSAFNTYTFVQTPLLQGGLTLVEFVKQAQESNFDGDEYRRRDADMIKDNLVVSGTSISLEADTVFAYKNPGSVTIITNGHRLLIRGGDWSQATIKVGFDPQVRSSDGKELSLYVLKMPVLEQQLDGAGLSLVNGSKGADAALDARCDGLLQKYLEDNQMPVVTCEAAQTELSGSDLVANLSLSETTAQAMITPAPGETLGDYVHFEIGGLSIFGPNDPFVTTEDTELFDENEQPTDEMIEILKDAPSNLSGDENSIIVPQGTFQFKSYSVDLNSSVLYGVKSSAQAESDQKLKQEFQKKISEDGSLPKNSDYSLSNELEVLPGADITKTALLNKKVAGSVEAVSQDGSVSFELTGDVDFFAKQNDPWSLTDAYSNELKAVYTGLALEAPSGTKGVDGPSATLAAGSDLTLVSSEYDKLVGRNGEKGNSLDLVFTSGSMTLACADGLDCEETDTGWTFEYTQSLVNLPAGSPVNVSFKKGELRGTYLYKAHDFHQLNGNLEIEVTQ